MTIIGKGRHAIVEDNQGNVTKKIILSYSRISSIFYYLKSYLPDCFLSKNDCYIKSYRIEHNFYRSHIPKGIEIPTIVETSIQYNPLSFRITMEKLWHRIGNENKEINMVIKNIAKFHINFWGLKIDVPVWNHGGYWTYHKRINEKRNFRTCYHTLFQLFHESWSKEQFENLCEWIILSESRVKQFYQNKQTLIHSDLHFENLFIRKENSNSKKELVFIDWQWVGYGNIATDLIYFLFTSIPSQHLHEENIYDYIRKYCLYNPLISYEDLLDQCITSSIDYFIYLVCCKWNCISFEEQELDSNSMNMRLHERIKKIFYILDVFSKLQ